jgi:hypothetical protein
MISYLSSFIWDEPEIKPSERQVQLRHLLHKQIVLNNMILKSIDTKPSISNALIDYELDRLTKQAKIPIKKKFKKRKYFNLK